MEFSGIQRLEKSELLKSKLRSKYGNLSINFAVTAHNFGFDFEAKIFDGDGRIIQSGYGQDEPAAVLELVRVLRFGEYTKPDSHIFGVSEMD